MEDLFVLIVFVIIVTGSAILNKLKAKLKKQQVATPQAGGLIVKLNALINAIARQIEQQGADRNTGDSDRDQILDGGETFSLTSDADEQPVDDWMVEEEVPQPRLKRRSPASPVRAHTIESDRTQFVPDTPRRQAMHAGKSSCTFMAASRADLRNAVIWSEILGPPVALRDEHSGKGGAS